MGLQSGQFQAIRVDVTERFGLRRQALHDVEVAHDSDDAAVSINDRQGSHPAFHHDIDRFLDVLIRFHADAGSRHDRAYGGRKPTGRSAGQLTPQWEDRSCREVRVTQESDEAACVVCDGQVADLQRSHHLQGFTNGRAGCDGARRAGHELMDVHGLKCKHGSSKGHTKSLAIEERVARTGLERSDVRQRLTSDSGRSQVDRLAC
jgi:hypothetical protein